LFLLPCFTLTAQTSNDIVRSKFYVGMDAGVGLLNLSQNGESQLSNPFSLGFYGGFMPFNWLRTGISIGGWLLEPYGNFYDDPAKGISISNTFLQIQAFPFKKFDLFLNFAGGISNYINHHPDEYNSKGTGILAGIGFERRLLGNLGISLLVNYGSGSFNDVIYSGVSVKNQKYKVTEFLIGFTYHIIPKKNLKSKTEKLDSLEQ
jgi:hypothetical protein